MSPRALDLGRALTAPLPPADFVLSGLLPGNFGLIAAPGATGKSPLELDIASESDRALYVAVDFAKTNYLAPRPRVWLRRGANGRPLQVQSPTTPKGVAVRGAHLLTT